jgi:hypothetical protein
MLLTPQSSRSLKKIGELVGVEKVELSPDRSTYKQIIKNMDRVRSEKWDLFKRYALMDAEICGLGRLDVRPTVVLELDIEVLGTVTFGDRHLEGFRLFNPHDPLDFRGRQRLIPSLNRQFD